MKLILLFIVVPLLELFLLLKLAQWTSPGFTFALVLITGIVGASLARRQGWGVIARLRGELDRGELPTATLVDALMIFVAGALLITPGVLTDAVGFSLLIPPVRRLYRAGLLKWIRAHVTMVTPGQHPQDSPWGGGETIDAQVISRRDADSKAS